MTSPTDTQRRVLVQLSDGEWRHGYDSALRSLRIAMAINAVTVLLCFAAIFVFFGGAQ